VADHSAEQIEQLTRVILGISDSLWRDFAERDETRLAGLPTEVIREIIDTPGVTMHEVADRLGKFPSNISVALRELSERGLVERIRDEKDRRAVRLYPSAATLHGIRSVLTSWGSLVREAVDELNPEEAERLLDALGPLTKVRNALKQ
jgi:DNA-binding MarR family transcriptional regulator